MVCATAKFLFHIHYSRRCRLPRDVSIISLLFIYWIAFCNLMQSACVSVVGQAPLPPYFNLSTHSHTHEPLHHKMERALFQPNHNHHEKCRKYCYKMHKINLMCFRFSLFAAPLPTFARYVCSFESLRRLQTRGSCWRVLLVSPIIIISFENDENDSGLLATTCLCMSHSFSGCCVLYAVCCALTSGTTSN